MVSVRASLYDTYIILNIALEITNYINVSRETEKLVALDCFDEELERNCDRILFIYL